MSVCMYVYIYIYIYTSITFNVGFHAADVHAGAGGALGWLNKHLLRFAVIRLMFCVLLS